MTKLTAFFLASLLLSTNISFSGDDETEERENSGDVLRRNDDQDGSNEQASGTLSEADARSAWLRKRAEVEKAQRDIQELDKAVDANEKTLILAIKTAQQNLLTAQNKVKEQKKALISKLNALRAEEADAAKADADAQVKKLHDISVGLQKKKQQMALEEMRMRKELKEMAAQMRKLIPADIDAPISKGHNKNNAPISTIPGIPSDPTRELNGLIGSGAQQLAAGAG
jgi:hypothetical protein